MTALQDAGPHRRLAPRGRMLRAEIRNGLRSLVRNPVSGIFTLLVPLTFLVYVNVANDGATIPGLDTSFAQATVPTVIVLSLVSSCYLGLTPTVVIAREQAILKRIRVTPMSPLLYLVARAVAAAVGAIFAVLIMVGIAIGFFGLRPSWVTLMGVFGLVVLGALTLCMLSFAATALCRNEQSSIGVTFMTAIPLLLAAGLFNPASDPSTVVRVVSDLLPIRPLGQGLMAAFGATVDGSVAFPARAIVTLVVWLGLATLLAVRSFRWEPRAS